MSCLAPWILHSGLQIAIHCAHPISCMHGKISAKSFMITHLPSSLTIVHRHQHKHTFSSSIIMHQSLYSSFITVDFHHPSSSVIFIFSFPSSFDLYSLLFFFRATLSSSFRHIFVYRWFILGAEKRGYSWMGSKRWATQKVSSKLWANSTHVQLAGSYVVGIKIWICLKIGLPVPSAS